MTAKKQDVFSKVVVTSDAYGAAQVDLSVLYDEAEHCALSLLNLGSKAACYSHDGVADAGELNPANASIGEVLDGIRRHSVSDPYQLPDSAADILIAHGQFQQLPLARLTANRAPVVQITGATAGQVLRIQRLDVGAFTYTLTSGGPGLATLVSCPVNCGFDLVLELVAGDWQVNGLSLYTAKKTGNAVALRNAVGDCDFGFCTADRLQFPAAYATPMIDAGQRATSGTAEDTTVICRKGATPGTDVGGNWVTRLAQEVGGVSSAHKYTAGVDGATALGQFEYFSGYFRMLAAGTKPMLFNRGRRSFSKLRRSTNGRSLGPRNTHRKRSRPPTRKSGLPVPQAWFTLALRE
jgi:hypothetical protein